MNLDDEIGRYIRKNLTARIGRSKITGRIVLQLWDGPMKFHESTVEIDSLTSDPDDGSERMEY